MIIKLLQFLLQNKHNCAQIRMEKSDQQNNYLQAITSKNAVQIANNESPEMLQNEVALAKHGKKVNRKKQVPKVDMAVFPLFFREIFNQQYVSNVDDHTQQRNNFIQSYIRSLCHFSAPDYKAILEDSLRLYVQEVEFKKKEHKIQFHQHLIRLFNLLMQSFRNNSVNFTIVGATYEKFEQMWLKEEDSELQTQIRNNLFVIWRQIPHQFFSRFLHSFKLQKYFHSIDSNKIIDQIIVLLFENKVHQACEYYHYYKNGKQFSEQQRVSFIKFEDQKLLPRIIKRDQLYSSHILDLLQNNENLKDKVFAFLEQTQYEKMVEKLGERVEDHPDVVLNAKRKHYLDYLVRLKKWYTIQDKISYDPQFVTWYCLQILEKFRQFPQKSFDGIKDLKEAEQITESMLFRANITKKQEKQIIKNPMYEYDAFMPATWIVEKINKQQKEHNLLELCQYGIEIDNVHFIDEMDENFEKAKKILLSSKIIGFDTEFLATSTKYEPGGVSIVQISSEKDCFIFDYKKLRDEALFESFFVQLMQSTHILKIGHTVSSDLKYLYQTFKTEIKFQGLIDLTKIFKLTFPNQVLSSLAFLTQKFLSKKLCKYEQRSNWNRRPLKKTQLFYASLDAFVCPLIYKQILQQGKNQSIFTQQLEKLNLEKNNDFKQAKLEGGYFDLIKYQKFLKEPKFLIDNMLKKLSTQLRNCGIDAEYVSIKDYEMILGLSRQQTRIIITRDTKLYKLRIAKDFPIYLLKQNSDTDEMVKQIQQTFQLDMSQYHTLSRCVKCNNPDLIIIDKEEAMKEIVFKHQLDPQKTFWRCSKCKQLYWQGLQFQKAKKKFEAMK